MRIEWLTLFAFSSENWQRPSREVTALLDLFASFLREQTEAWARHDVRLTVLGRRDRFGSVLRSEVERAEESTRPGRGLRLRLAIDYSGREAIVEAARRSRALGDVSRESFARLLADDEDVAPGVDLLIRTGGEKRLSDFLLWESAWAELVFLETMWPDFETADLEQALHEFRERDRRFGRITRG